MVFVGADVGCLCCARAGKSRSYSVPDAEVSPGWKCQRASLSTPEGQAWHRSNASAEVEFHAAHASAWALREKVCAPSSRWCNGRGLIARSRVPAKCGSGWRKRCIMQDIARVWTSSCRSAGDAGGARRSRFGVRSKHGAGVPLTRAFDLAQAMSRSRLCSAHDSRCQISRDEIGRFVHL